MRAGRCFVLTVAVLVAVTAARAPRAGGAATGLRHRHDGRAGARRVVVEATTADLGLRREDLPAGLRYGGAAFGLVLAALLVAAALPLTRGFLHDARGEIDAGQLAYELGVNVVLLTAVPEEFAFRGVLLGSAVRLWGAWRGVLVTSAALRAVAREPTLDTMGDNPAVRGGNAGSSSCSGRSPSRSSPASPSPGSGFGRAACSPRCSRTSRRTDSRSPSPGSSSTRAVRGWPPPSRAASPAGRG